MSTKRIYRIVSAIPFYQLSREEMIFLIQRTGENLRLHEKAQAMLDVKQNVFDPLYCEMKAYMQARGEL